MFVSFYFIAGPVRSGNLLYVQASRETHGNPWCLHNARHTVDVPRGQGGRKGGGWGQHWPWLETSQSQFHNAPFDQSQPLWASFPPTAKQGWKHLPWLPPGTDRDLWWDQCKLNLKLESTRPMEDSIVLSIQPTYPLHALSKEARVPCPQWDGLSHRAYTFS